MNDRKRTIEELIDAAALRGAKATVNLQHQQRNINLYRATERLLRAYPKRVHLMEHPEEFDFFPAGRSKDISIAPPPGSGVVDKVEAAEMFVAARKDAYEHEMYLLHETEYAIAAYRNKPEFIVIQMLYWNTDVYGNERPEGCKGWTFEEIQEELASIGTRRNIKTLRIWRTKLVQDMTVMLFGAEGAVSVEAREPKQSGHVEEA